MKLATEKPRVRVRAVGRQFDDFAQIGDRRSPGDYQPVLCELAEQCAVDLVAVAMTLDDLCLAVNRPRQRAINELAALTAKTHGAAQIGILVSFFEPTRGAVSYTHLDVYKRQVLWLRATRSRRQKAQPHDP